MKITTLSFDCYGTLIDWEGGIWTALQPLITSNSSAITRAQGLSLFAAIENEIQAAEPTMPYHHILKEVHRRFAKEEQLKTSTDLDQIFGQSVAFWPAFPDSLDALRLLKKHYKLVILSNVDNAGFAHSNAKIGVDFDAVYTAETVGSYKPNINNFHYMIKDLKENLNISSENIMHVAQSMFHDIAPADEIGLRTTWIDRQNLSGGGDWGATPKIDNMPKPEAIYPTLEAFANSVCGK